MKRKSSRLGRAVPLLGFVEGVHLVGEVHRGRVRGRVKVEGRTFTTLLATTTVASTAHGLTVGSPKVMKNHP